VPATAEYERLKTSISDIVSTVPAASQKVSKQESPVGRKALRAK